MHYTWQHMHKHTYLDDIQDGSLQLSVVLLPATATKIQAESYPMR